jgi:carboxypeptidase T
MEVSMKIRRTLAPWLVVALALAGCQKASTDADNTLSSAEQAAFDQNELVISRVQFPDAATGRKVAISHEPIEIDYKAGYLLTDLDREEFAKLRQLEPSFNISVGVDNKLTSQQSALLRRIDQQGLSNISTQSISGFSCYRTVEETFTTAQNIVSNYPNLATWSDVGNSWQKTRNAANGYDMRVLKLTNNSTTGTKPKTFIISAIHAREYTTAELATRFAEYLVSNYGSNADVTWMLDTQEVHLMLQANPDGRKKAEAGVLWRKNNNTNYCNSSKKGADLNRNSSFEWNTGGSSANQCSDTYRGPSAASEPETQAIQNYASSIFPDARGPAKTDAAPASTSGLFLTLHSYSELVLYPWGNTSTVAPNGVALRTLARKFAFFNNYTPQQSIGLYPTSGTTDDYVYGTLGTAAFTFELGTSFFQPCADFTNTILQSNLNALLYGVRVSRAPYQLPSGPEALSVAISGNTLSATLNDARYNNSNGAEATQIVAAAEYYVDTPPWAAGAVANPMSATDGAFSTSSEAVRATINTSLSSGRHTLYVRGRDSSGNWGAVGAVFLNVP